MEAILDHRLQAFLRQKMRETPEYMVEFRAIYYCGSKVIKAPGWMPGVFVLKNDESAKYFGSVSCKSAWACPVCSARMMSKYAADIGCALDALKERYNQRAFMLTLTTLHTRFMSCKEVYTIILEAWKKFTIRGNKNQQTCDKKTKKKIWKNKDPFARFAEECGNTHRVRVCEFTFGKHGWHPHFHCLFWVPKENLQKVAEYEDELRERWETLLKRQILKAMQKKNPDKAERYKKAVEHIWKHRTQDKSSLHISKDKNGKVRAIESSEYICGWGGDLELTGNYRKEATHKGHMTPYQLLKKAQETGQQKYFNEFMYYVRATKRSCRVMFSKNSGLKKIIEEWKKTQAYTERLKKKFMDVRQKQGKWRLVCWFTEKQWFEICLNERKQENIRCEILRLAMLKNGRKLVEDFLLKHGIDITQNARHPRQEIVEDLFGIAS